MVDPGTNKLYGERARKLERELAEKTRARTTAANRERAAVRTFVDDVLGELSLRRSTRAVSDVTSEDVLGSRYAPAPLAFAWPTVDALNLGGRLVAVAPTRAIGAAAVTLPTPTPTLVATEQTMEKAEVGSGTPTMGVEVASWDTYGIAVDLALQADEARARVQAWLDAAVAQAIDQALLAALATAAGSGVADLGAAVNAVSGYPGPILVVAPVGTADLQASGYEVVVDPNATKLLVVNASGVSVQVFGPFRLEALRPSHLGTDLSSYGDLVGPLIGTGAVATLTAA